MRNPYGDSPEYDSDDPYRPGGPLADAQLAWEAGQPAYTTAQFRQDVRT
ncbi:hypothetical protein PBI_RHYNO_52 [Mycobacterium phage RhynO]|uniref:Uncharacterized protein n=4 Tax=Fromanvirus TaxID=186764 RepID=H9NCP7_9CAUD|nr:hypothetical protein CG97_gp30 [Mycobacterium phage RhynO]YP_009607520.1 hypothetical protein FDI09_gp46 [Mycobacterium phage Twister]YP_009638879.1 hypothetical protein FGG47_gp44 [Mycobacterium phage Rebeuca]QBP32000.1 hypothetical protein SEA_KRISTOFF_51 [Mycobacterium phage Kristoff]QGJ94727.1 hypothetical protein SEA_WALTERMCMICKEY_49 [Mycobacterium phage WalterMcMickey]AFF28368.1 hypothetical protein TWISTER_49 [Mycobacterium phage Twister]AFQ97359.1 hypothetical protein REBEUCA_51 [